MIQWNLDLRKPNLRKNLDLRKIVATTDFFVHTYLWSRKRTRLSMINFLLQVLKFKSDYNLCTYPLFRNNQNCLDTKVRSYPLHILVFQCSDCHCHSLLRLFCKDWCLNSTSRSFHMLKMNYSVEGQTSYFGGHTSKKPCSVHSSVH